MDMKKALLTKDEEAYSNEKTTGKVNSDTTFSPDSPDKPLNSSKLDHVKVLLMRLKERRSHGYCRNDRENKCREGWNCKYLHADFEEMANSMIEEGIKEVQQDTTGNMDSLEFCRHFKNGNCRKGDQCIFLHVDIHGIVEKAIQECIAQIEKDNVNQQINDYCVNYKYGRCLNGSNCKYIHAEISEIEVQENLKRMQQKGSFPQYCRDFLNGYCEHGETCKYLHKDLIDKTLKECIEQRRSGKIVKSAFKGFVDRSDSFVKSKRPIQICINYLKRRCKYGEKCKHIHVDSSTIGELIRFDTVDEKQMEMLYQQIDEYSKDHYKGSAKTLDKCSLTHLGLENVIKNLERECDEEIMKRSYYINEVCRNHIRGRCKFGSRCSYIHIDVDKVVENINIENMDVLIDKTNEQKQGYCKGVSNGYDEENMENDMNISKPNNESFKKISNAIGKRNDVEKKSIKINVKESTERESKIDEKKNKNDTYQMERFNHIDKWDLIKDDDSSDDFYNLQNSTNPEDKSAKPKRFLCKNYQKGICRFGDKCLYIHSNLHDVDNFPKEINEDNLEVEKSRVCWNYQHRGKCPYGDKCIFVHPKSDENLDNYAKEIQDEISVDKTRICWNYQKLGKCNFGDRCIYVHADIDENENSTKEQENSSADQLSKAGYCVNYQKGKCNYGDKCMFIHEFIDYGADMATKERNVNTRLDNPFLFGYCWNFQRGLCKLGSNCPYNHILLEKKNIENLMNENDGVQKQSKPANAAICKYFYKRGSCHFGDKCSFAHTEVDPTAELHSEKSRKTEYCRNFQRGKCYLGDKCIYLHGDSDERLFKENVEKRYKTCENNTFEENDLDKSVYIRKTNAEQGEMGNLENKMNSFQKKQISSTVSSRIDDVSSPATSDSVKKEVTSLPAYSDDIKMAAAELERSLKDNELMELKESNRQMKIEIDILKKSVLANDKEIIRMEQECLNKLESGISVVREEVFTFMNEQKKVVLKDFYTLSTKLDDSLKVFAKQKDMIEGNVRDLYQQMSSMDNSIRSEIAILKLPHQMPSSEFLDEFKKTFNEQMDIIAKSLKSVNLRVDSLNERETNLDEIRTGMQKLHSQQIDSYQDMECMKQQITQVVDCVLRKQKQCTPTEFLCQDEQKNAIAQDSRFLSMEDIDSRMDYSVSSSEGWKPILPLNSNSHPIPDRLSESQSNDSSPKTNMSLPNTDLSCYRNVAIQCLSSCPLFVADIKRLAARYLSVTNLVALSELLTVMTTKVHGKGVEISKNLIFADWIRIGQQDSFELLSYIMKQVYDDIRTEQVKQGMLKEESLDEWLEQSLPLRLKKVYLLACQCGNESWSSPVTDVAMRFSLPGRQNFSIQSLMTRYFDGESIEGYSCPVCQSMNAVRYMQLCQPIPDTLCIHLPKGFWTSNRIRKLSGSVKFPKKVYIKETYFDAVSRARDAASKKSDTSQNQPCNRPNKKASGTQNDSTKHKTKYHLVAVIVLYGDGSGDHSVCYRYIGDRWYLMDDCEMKPVSDESVFVCNPYIMMYEKDR